jgi:hypothetical protein
MQSHGVTSGVGCANLMGLPGPFNEFTEATLMCPLFRKAEVPQPMLRAVLWDGR